MTCQWYKHVNHWHILPISVKISHLFIAAHNLQRQFEKKQIRLLNQEGESVDFNDIVKALYKWIENKLFQLPY